MEKTEKQDAFRKQLATIAAQGVLSMSIALGYRLNLFDALAKVASEKDPKTAKEIADAADMKERYVQEWLNTMACGSIIEITESGDHYWIPQERVADLVHGTPHAMMSAQEFMPIFGEVFDKICQVFHKNGPLGMQSESYTDLHRVMDEISRVNHKSKLINDFLPLTGLTEKLTTGLSALDVDCFSGFYTSHFAENFPNSNFIGTDGSLNAVMAATQAMSVDGKGHQNLAFVQKEAFKLNDDWTEKFDWVSIFKSVHDQQRPDLILKEIHRVLKPDGVFTLLDIKGSSNAYTDRQLGGLQAALLYGVSVFHCLPVGSDSKDALSLGAMWGQKRAVEFLNAAGFSNVQVVPTPFFAINVLYICKK